MRGRSRVKRLLGFLLLTLALRPRGWAGASTGGLLLSPFDPMRMYATAPAIALLPRAPKNTSPVPGLTSLYHKAYRGPYGNAGYPGNCGGELIKDLLRYFQPTHVPDPVIGSSTRFGLKYRSKSLISSPPQLPG